jgi:hypothetical protein
VAPERVTFAVIGHNEASTLPRSLGQAFGAADQGDQIWYVDSASTDDSRDIAHKLGASIVEAPLGKGNAVAAARQRCRAGLLCLIDADIIRSEHNIARRLRDAATRSPADMIIGEYDEVDRRRMVTPSIFRPLTAALFPEVGALELRGPLSGFRSLRADLDLGHLPPGYGVETHLDIQATLAGYRVETCQLGSYDGPLRDYTNVPAIAADVAAAILDLGEQHGRLSPTGRTDWDGWLAPVLDLLATPPPAGEDDTDFLSALARASARPVPGRVDEPGRVS